MGSLFRYRNEKWNLSPTGAIGVAWFKVKSNDISFSGYDKDSNGIRFVADLGLNYRIGLQWEIAGGVQYSVFPHYKDYHPYLTLSWGW
ncbi:MAG: hypothetical protein AB7F43_11760 [Bacteriovoracia bacterium]